jgi:3-oxoacyl-[acyl-carrier protein] reductase
MLKGKTAIVTGAGRGIGKAIARRFAAADANVVIAARNEKELNETKRLISGAGGNCLAIAADVTLAADVEKLVDEAYRAFGRIDAMVNNAGIAPRAEIDALEPDQFDAIVAINIRAVYLCCRAAWPRLAESRGAIVNISSVAALDPFPGFAAYGASKAFVNTFSKALAAEGRPLGIRVFCVAPGAVETQMLRTPFPDFPADQTLSPDQVAALVEWLLSPTAEHVSGQVITINRS